jgi:hypothetical protein
MPALGCGLWVGEWEPREVRLANGDDTSGPKPPCIGPAGVLI